MLFSCSLAHPTVTFRKDAFRDGPYPGGEEAEDHCCWLNLPLEINFGNVSDVVTYIRRHQGSRSASAATAIKQSSYGAARRFLATHCDSSDAVNELTDNDIATLWGADASSAEQAR